MRILDIGCNVGSSAVAAVQHRFMWFGMDEDYAMVSHAPRHVCETFMRGSMDDYAALEEWIRGTVYLFVYIVE